MAPAWITPQVTLSTATPPVDRSADDGCAGDGLRRVSCGHRAPKTTTEKIASAIAYHFACLDQLPVSSRKAGMSPVTMPSRAATAPVYLPIESFLRASKTKNRAQR